MMNNNTTYSDNLYFKWYHPDNLKSMLEDKNNRLNDSLKSSTINNITDVNGSNEIFVTWERLIIFTIFNLIVACIKYCCYNKDKNNKKKTSLILNYKNLLEFELIPLIAYTFYCLKTMKNSGYNLYIDYLINIISYLINSNIFNAFLLLLVIITLCFRVITFYQILVFILSILLTHTLHNIDIYNILYMIASLDRKVSIFFLSSLMILICIYKVLFSYDASLKDYMIIQNIAHLLTDIIFFIFIFISSMFNVISDFFHLINIEALLGPNPSLDFNHFFKLFCLLVGIFLIALFVSILASSRFKKSSSIPTDNATMPSDDHLDSLPVYTISTLSATFTTFLALFILNACSLYYNPGSLYFMKLGVFWCSIIYFTFYLKKYIRVICHYIHNINIIKNFFVSDFLGYLSIQE